MILNIGQRTDIPAFFSEWFYNRIRAGFVLVRNPYHPELITRYALDPQVVDVLSFCTKNPAPMLDRLDEIRAFRQFWSITITPYGKEIEPNVPDKREIIKAVKILSAKIGSKCISIRYDPIFISKKYSIHFHIRAFERLLSELEGYTEQAVISFIDLYQKTKRNFPQLREVPLQEQKQIAAAFAGIGKRHGVLIRSCCENPALSEYGLDTGGCLTKEVLEYAIGENLCVPNRKGPRAQCSCLLGNDIGAYNTCMHLCKYCYANFDKNTVLRNFKQHDPHSPLLIGDVAPGDKIKEAKQQSFLCPQLHF